nr:hypothetical protein [Olegusella massiliensis]
MRPSLQNTRHSLNIDMNSSMPTPFQSRWKKNPSFNLPKKPSIAELSGEHAFFDIDPMSPLASHIDTHPGQR